MNPGISNVSVSARPEEKLLERCLRVSVGSENVLTVPELVRQVDDWERLFRVASRHGIAPLVCHILNQIDASEIPASGLARRQAATRRQAMRSAQITGALVELLDLLEANRIPAVPFKGPVLAFLLYGDAKCRESADLDVLISARDVLRAKDVMVAHGYRTDCPTDPAAQAAYLRVRYELHFVSPDGPCPVELHQAFLPPFNQLAYDYDALWQRLERIRLYDRDVLVLPPEDLLLALCAHSTKHK